MGARLVHDLLKVGSRVVVPALALAMSVAACAPARSPPPPVLSISPTPPVDGGGRDAPPITRARLTTVQAERARDLLEALGEAERGQRAGLLAALRDEVGGAGLVMALDTVAGEPEQRRWFETQQLLTMIRELADPDAVDALAAWAAEADRHIHWQGVAGAALAEVGDLRAAPLLATRLRRSSADLYAKDKFWQADAGGHLLRGDRQRVVAARLLGDLALVHPQRAGQLRDQAEEAVVGWLTERPQPHANGLRFLAAAQSVDSIPRLRAWAFPTDPLPAAGAMPPFPMAYETAQIALRYLGWMRHRPSLKAMLQQLRRKDPGLDISQQGLMGAGIAMRGMALRAVAYGAVQGLSHWGRDTGKATRHALVTLIEDETWHEDARQAACVALPWVAGASWLETLTSKVESFGFQKGEQKQFIASCYAEALEQSALPEATTKLARLMKAPIGAELHLAVARALGRAGVPSHGAAATMLREMLAVPDLQGPATLAIMLGGGPDDTVAVLQQFPKSVDDVATAELADAYYRSFGYVSTRDLSSGALSRWVANARAAAGAGHGWVMERLRGQFANLEYDNGPHSLTRPVLRFELMRAARSGALSQRRKAIEVLGVLMEQGALMALARDEDEHAGVAREALEELMRAQGEEP